MTALGAGYNLVSNQPAITPSQHLHVIITSTWPGFLSIINSFFLNLIVTLVLSAYLENVEGITLKQIDKICFNMCCLMIYFIIHYYKLICFFFNYNILNESYCFYYL